MADIILSPLLQVVFDRLASPILKSLGDFYDLKHNFQDLQKFLLTAQDVLEDAEDQHRPLTCNRALNNWLLKLKEAAYNAEDLLDRLTVHLKRSEAQEAGRNLGFFQEAGRNLGFFQKTMLLKEADELRKMLDELGKIAAEGSNLHLTRNEAAVTAASRRRETGSFVAESEVYGRMDDKEKIVEQLLDVEGRGENVCFVPIVGLGGLGKTTLAQLAYNDRRVMQHFDVRMWVFVSDDFDVKKVLKDMVESTTMKSCDDLSVDVIQSMLIRVLHGKRYLVVLDDVWNEDEEEWGMLESLFRFLGCKGGSKVIITTRSNKVASIISSPTFSYQLKGLAEGDCWMLFKRWAFPRGEENDYPKLLPIGKEIIKKSKGMPSVVKVLGSFLRSKREERDWSFLRNKDLYDLDVYQSKILPSLRFSYLHLKSHQRHCFSFCSVFPKGYVIKKEKLIRMWTAAGLIQSEEASKRAEQTGSECFEDLLQIFFIQESAEIDSTATDGYIIPDIVHDLAKSIAGKESVTLEPGVFSGSLLQTRHSSVICECTSENITENLCVAKHLRSLMLVARDGIQDDTAKIFTSFPFLRILDLNACGLTRLSQSIDNLMCLRYLDLSDTPIRFLPYGTMEKFLLLQTLDLCGCHNLKELPAISKMPSLKHLNITGCQALTSMSPFFPGMHRAYGLTLGTMAKRQKFFNSTFLPGPSNQLQSLPTIVISGFLDLMFLGRLDLRGELNIRHLESLSSSPEDAENANLINKGNLESLGLFWENEDNNSISTCNLVDQVQETTHGGGQAGQHHSSEPLKAEKPESNMAEEVINGLKPHQNLKCLLVQGYPGVRFPRWRLLNLTQLTLKNCRNCEHLPVLGNLVALEKISLQGFHAVKCIGKEFYGLGISSRHFPRLKELVFADFPNLEEWFGADCSDSFPCLTKLIISCCPKLLTMPFFQFLKHLELRDCDAVLFDYLGGICSLETLIIERIANLIAFPGDFIASNYLLSSLEIISFPSLSPFEMDNISSLGSIKVRQCKELSNLLHGFQNLQALKSLEVSDCHDIISMPEIGIGGLSSLKAFHINNCANLTCLSMETQLLIHLEHLAITSCPSLVSFAMDKRHLSALQRLTISNCPQISSLPEELQYLEALYCLEIRSCPGLTALPEWIGGINSLASLIISSCQGLKQLPESIELLTALQQLSIDHCPELEDKCQEEVGQDWHKIAHVPLRCIGSSKVRQAISGCSSV